MKILKKGETIPFECNCCGCQFVVGINSIENKDGNFYANCPCCGSECHTDWARISSARRENEKSESTAGKLRNENEYIVKYSNNALQLLPDVMQGLVRCKDCKYIVCTRARPNKSRPCDAPAEQMYHCYRCRAQEKYGSILKVELSDFCSHGEKRNGDMCCND